MSRTGYMICEDMLALDALMADEEINWDDPEAQKILCGYFEEFESELEIKVENTIAMIKEWESTASVRKAEAARLSALAKTDDNKAKRLKEHLKNNLETIGRNKVETPLFKVTIANNGGVAPLKTPDNVMDLPEECIRTEYKVNTSLIREKLVAGEAVRGCALGERGTSLRIK